MSLVIVLCDKISQTINNQTITYIQLYEVHSQIDSVLLYVVLVADFTILFLTSKTVGSRL